jgi:hypothetical protein
MPSPWSPGENDNRSDGWKYMGIYQGEKFDKHGKSGSGIYSLIQLEKTRVTSKTPAISLAKA